MCRDMSRRSIYHMFTACDRLIIFLSPVLAILGLYCLQVDVLLVNTVGLSLVFCFFFYFSSLTNLHFYGLQGVSADY